MRHPPPARHRQRAREVARAREGEELARVGVDDREEARDQAGEAGVVDELADERALAVCGVGGQRQRVVGVHDRLRAGAARRQREDQRREHEQDQHRDDDAPGHVALGVARLLGGERHALDREEEPDAVDERAEHAGVAERQEVAGAGLARVGLDVGQVRRAELGDHPEHEDDERDDRQRRDREHHLERLADADQVHADEDGVEEEVQRPAGGDAEDVQRLDVAADEHDDRRRRDRVLDEDRRAGEKAAPRAHRPARERVAAARGRHRRRHLRQREDHARVHERP